MFSPEDHLYMRRAMELAQRGTGLVSPNPLVGCVIVQGERIIGEGWHQKYGDWHAEVNALDSVREKMLLPESTVYVNLEPCSHFGKTPPCADRLIRDKVKKVVLANRDPFPLVNGKGIEKLQQAGIEVEEGLLEVEGRHLNRRFFTYVEKQRPYVLLKWAETADGYMARADYSSKWISGELSRVQVHRMRAEEAAVMVGTNTAKYDNPRLNVRDWFGPDPVRVAIDTTLRLPSQLHLFDKTQPTLLYNLVKNESFHNLEYIRLDPEKEYIPQVLNDLHKRKIQSLLVEGGAMLLQSFIEAGVWDEAWIFKSKNSFGSGIIAPRMPGTLREIKTLGEDALFWMGREA